jgi:RNA binding exosome subunit
MAENNFSSPAIAKELQKRYGNKTKVVKISMQHEEEVKNFVMKIEEAHKKAAKSKLPSY